MDESVKTLLDNEIRNEFENLSMLEQGSEEHAKAVDNLAKLYKLKTDEERVKQETKDQALDRYIRLGVEIAGIVLPLAFYGYWMRRGFEFEANGTFTSTTFRGLFSRFRPTRK